jgi:hypothetical protein
MTNGSVQGVAWTPVTANVGQTFNVTFTVSSQGLSDSKVVVIRVVDASKLTVVNAASYRGEGLREIRSLQLLERTWQHGRCSTMFFRCQWTWQDESHCQWSPCAIILCLSSSAQLCHSVSVELGPATIIVSNPTDRLQWRSRDCSSAPSIFSADSSGSGDRLRRRRPMGSRIRIRHLM